MIQIKPNFLPEALLAITQELAYTSNYSIAELGNGKQLHYIQTPMELLEYLEIPDHDIVLTFIRKADKNTDNLPNIHADNIINGEKIVKAGVLYLNKSSSCSPNGTAFWKNVKYGVSLPSDVTNEEYDRLLTEESNDLSFWERTEFIENIENRFVLYPANMFHSKFPFVIEEGSRIVLVVFYSSKKDKG